MVSSLTATPLRLVNDKLVVLTLVAGILQENCLKVSMATATASEVLHCSICLDVPKDPRRIPCLDVFCRVCLSGLIERSSGRGVFKCPNCRYEHKIPQNGTDAFPVAYAPVFKRPCPLHVTKKLRMFCSECDTLICIECRDSRHINHSTTTQLMDIVKERRRYIEWSCAELHENKKNLTSISISLMKQSKALAISKAKEIKAIENQAAHLKATIDRVANDLVATLTSKYKTNEDSVASEKLSVEEKKKETCEWLDVADSIVRDTDVHPLFTDFQQLKELKDKILTTCTNNPTENNKIQTLFAKGICKKKKLQAMIGSIKLPLLNNVNHNKSSGPPLKWCSRYIVLPDIRPASAQNVSVRAEPNPTVTSVTRPSTHR